MKINKKFIETGCRIHAKNVIPCLKKAVYTVIVTKNNDYIFGSNWIEDTSVKECPRINLPSGEGYHLCVEVCKQKAHAEESAIIKAKELNIDIKGAELFLTGHEYCCKNCIETMRNSGIKYAKCIDSGKEYIL